jgi:hypothetical protein
MPLLPAHCWPAPSRSSGAGQQLLMKCLSLSQSPCRCQMHLAHVHHSPSPGPAGKPASSPNSPPCTPMQVNMWNIRLCCLKHFTRRGARWSHQAIFTLGCTVCSCCSQLLCRPCKGYWYSPPGLQMLMAPPPAGGAPALCQGGHCHHCHGCCLGQWWQQLQLWRLLQHQGSCGCRTAQHGYQLHGHCRPG